MTESNEMNPYASPRVRVEKVAQAPTPRGRIEGDCVVIRSGGVLPMRCCATRGFMPVFLTRWSLKMAGRAVKRRKYWSSYIAVGSFLGNGTEALGGKRSSFSNAQMARS